MVMNFSIRDHAPTMEEPSLIPTPFRGLRVLLVDNDTESLLQIASTLEQHSYRVTTTELAAVALSILQERTDRFDLVLADINMPEMDCFKFIERVQHIKDLPIIMMSMELEKDTIDEALKKGACFFLKKPVSSKTLKNVWQHVCRKRNQEQVTDGKANREIDAGKKIGPQDAKAEGMNQVLDGQKPIKLTGISNRTKVNNQPGGSKRKRTDDVGGSRAAAKTNFDYHKTKATKTTCEEGMKAIEVNHKRVQEKKVSDLIQGKISSSLQKDRVQLPATELTTANRPSKMYNSSTRFNSARPKESPSTISSTASLIKEARGKQSQEFQERNGPTDSPTERLTNSGTLQETNAMYFIQGTGKW